MLRLLVIATVGGVLFAGCGHGADSIEASKGFAPKTKEKPTDPIESTRAGMHEGAFLLGNAAADLETAITAAKALQASTKNIDLKAALADILEKLDDAGASIADFTGEPPELADFKKDFDTQDKKRLDSVDGANDALHDVNDSNDVLDDFAAKPAAIDEQGLSALVDALDAAASDLTDAITAFGGKVEADDTQTVPVPDASRARKPGLRPDL